ncbi:MAG TPA: AMP-binding protein [Acidimicrobiales bacterium]|nr:AMP-binding protein [Acidimicrobiales bacterium]
MSGTNYADVWEAIAEVQPDALAQLQGDRRFTWAEFDRRADAFAAAMLEVDGVGKQAKVAQYLQNCPEYIESVYGGWKVGLVPVNTNYRYTDDELVYLWDNADAVAVVFHGSFTPTIERIRDKVPGVKRWFWVDDDGSAMPDWAVSYEAIVSKGAAGARTTAPWGRDGDDLYMLYTGGTTGMPKGTMWRQDDIFWLVNPGTMPPYPEGSTIEQMMEQRKAIGAGMKSMPACPLMHGTGALSSFGVLQTGGAIVLMENRSFDPAEMFELVEREGVNVLVIVGDAFAKPMVRTLDDQPGKWDISSIVAIISSGVMWSEPVKQALLKHHPNMILADSLGSSEAVGMGASQSTGDSAAETAKFTLGANAVVVSEDNRVLGPGEGIGRLGIKGRVPVGYYKDEVKSAATFPVIDGVRYSLPGDFAQIEDDGSITLLGRGSVCINTGGEKVFPEEVEEVLKLHPSIRDAVAVAVPDEKFGEVVTAMVEPEPGASIDEGDVIAHVKGKLAAFKAPKHVVVVDTIGRAPNAKVDYKRLKALAAERVGVGS